MPPIARQTPTPLVLVLALLVPACWAFIGQLPGTCLQAVQSSGRAQERTKRAAPFMNNASAEPAVEQEVRALKQAILDQAAGTSNGLKATDQQRKAISEAVNGLTARNPTEDVATSELATGMWNLLYTTTPGASGGKLGPFIGDVQQEVDIAEGLYVNYVRLGPLTGKLDATWDVINKQQWKVVFKTIAFLLWGREVVKKDLGQEGLWTLSYLDDDMRILAARSLERDTGNLYILTRA